jgi:ribonuclease P protein component
MLSKKYRLSKTEIPVIARKGKRFQGELFDLKLWFDNNLSNSLFTIAVSTKVSKKATIRNTIKRKFRASLKNLENTLRKGKYLFVIKSEKLAEMKSQEIEELITKLVT